MVHVTTRELQDAGLSRREAVRMTQRDYDNRHSMLVGVAQVKMRRAGRVKKAQIKGPTIVRK